MIRAANASERDRHSFSPFAANWSMNLISVAAVGDGAPPAVSITGDNVRVAPGKYMVTAKCRGRSALGVPDLFSRTVSKTLNVSARREYALACSGRALAFVRLQALVLFPGASPEELAQDAEERALAMAEWKAEVFDAVLAKWARPTDIAGPIAWEIRAKVDEDGVLRNLSWVTHLTSRSLEKSVIKAFRSASPYPPPPEPREARQNGIVFSFSDAPAAGEAAPEAAQPDVADHASP